MTLRSIEGGKAKDPLAQRREAERTRVEVFKARIQRWRMQHGDKLEAMHPDVAAEVASVVWGRYAEANEAPMTAEDLRQCRMRVATRLRLKRYGKCTDDEETARQLRECLAEVADRTAAA